MLAAAERQYLATRPDRSVRQTKLPTYVELGTHCFGPWVGGLIWVGVVATILGVCGVYLDFIGHELNVITNNAVSQKGFMLLCAIPLIFLSWLRSLKYLVHTSLVGDVAVTSGIISVLIYGIVTAKHVENPFHMPFINSTFADFFGQCVFLFAIHVVILPISQSMEEPALFPKVANGSFTLIVIVNGIFGFVGYLLYGANTKGLVIDNVSGPLGTVVKILLCFDLFFTVPIVLTAPRELIEGAIMTRWGENNEFWKRNFIRTMTVCLFVVISLAVPNINNLATLVGCVVSPLMGFILPPSFYMYFNWTDLSVGSKVFHSLIVAFGAFACVFTTEQAIVQIFF